MKPTDLKTMLMQQEEIPNMPLLELAGDRRILIENHKGICSYGTDRISVRVRFGIIELCGQQMELSMISKEKLIVTGMIDTIQLRRRC